jgi:spore germination protein KB
MENARISLFQLFTLLVFFIVGTTVMFPLASDAKQAAWVAVLFAMLGGIVLFELYQYLYRQYPDLLFADYTKRILGNYVGTIIGISYTVFFLYGAARDVRDGMELLSLKFSETPITFLGGLLILVIMYGLYMGIEVISRCSEILFIILLGMGILFAVFVFVSGIVKLENLLPILEPGWKTIISTAMKESWMAPFGEVVCFTAIFPYLNRANGQLRVGLGGVIAGGLFLAFAHALTIAVIGSRARDNAISPLLKMVQQVNVGDFIQRLDSFFMIWLIINDFF